MLYSFVDISVLFWLVCFLGFGEGGRKGDMHVYRDLLENLTVMYHTLLWAFLVRTKRLLIASIDCAVSHVIKVKIAKHFTTRNETDIVHCNCANNYVVTCNHK